MIELAPCGDEFAQVLHRLSRRGLRSRHPLCRALVVSGKFRQHGIRSCHLCLDVVRSKDLVSYPLNQSCQSLVSQGAQKKRPIKRVEACLSKRRRVTTIVDIGGCEQCVLDIRGEKRANTARPFSDCLHAQPSISETREKSRSTFGSLPTVRNGLSQWTVTMDCH